jgi:anti-sigma regulatory factor (Ser/Thr protein kinase)
MVQMDEGAVAVRHDPSSAALVRRAIADDLDAHGVSRDAIDDVVLVVSELVGNAVLHAGPPEDHRLDVNWEIDEAAVTVHVGDGSPDRPQPRISGATEAGGRGLAIINAIAADWGVRRTAFGKEVWARIAVRPA